MSTGDYQKWQAKYLASEGALRGVDPFFERITDRLPTEGRGLDVAGGLGRHGIWMASRGLDVTLVDIAPAGLALARRNAENRGVALVTVAADLEAGQLGEELHGPFDLIAVAWFLPTRTLWATLAAALAPGGALVHVQPSQKNAERHASPSPRFLADAEALRPTLEALGLQLEVFEEGWDEDEHHTLRVLARPPSTETYPERTP